MKNISHRIHTHKANITVHLTYYLEGLDSTKQVNLLLFNVSKAIESKQVKQEVSRLMILPL